MYAPHSRDIYGTVKITKREIFPATKTKIQVLKNVDVVPVNGKRFALHWKDKTMQN
jgi:hypothetical protein